MPTDPLQPLMDMGLTGLEARAYAYLLEHAPATGYGIAKGLGKPTANTYKAVESLYERGAVIREDSGNREYRPVAPAELLGALELRFKERKQRAATELDRLKGGSQDDRVYRLATAEQVLERMRHMLTAATRVAVLDLFPGSVAALRPDLESAATRGVSVVVKVYQASPLAGVRVVLDPHAAEVVERWPGQWCNGVVDGREHLLAWLSADGTRVHQAIWSGSPFLSCVYHTSLLNEVLCSELETALQQDQSRSAMLATLTEFNALLNDPTPGYRSLHDQVADGPGPEKGSSLGEGHSEGHDKT